MLRKIVNKSSLKLALLLEDKLNKYHSKYKWALSKSPKKVHLKFNSGHMLLCTTFMNVEKHYGFYNGNSIFCFYTYTNYK